MPFALFAPLRSSREKTMLGSREGREGAKNAKGARPPAWLPGWKQSVGQKVHFVMTKILTLTAPAPILHSDLTEPILSGRMRGEHKRRSHAPQEDLL